MAWFADALARHGGGPDAIVAALVEWLRDPGYRGCAFINSVGELAGSLPEVREIAAENLACRRFGPVQPDGGFQRIAFRHPLTQ
jgi:hypothetical protein